MTAAGKWLSERMSNAIGTHANGGWFNISNGWTTDSAGIVMLRAHTGGGGGSVDAVLYVNGIQEAESHQANSTISWCKCALVPKGAVVKYSVGGSQGKLDYFRFRRML
ncbi:hypothetical protein CCF60_003147 [Salmonella enterica subsp. enterica serovar Berkeley]|nr:hypothetical protein [Salmonella enterica subsp. enterica serovar Berkeley]